MLRSVNITNHLGEDLYIDIFNPLESGFAIRKIDGLGPVSANITMTDIITLDGSLFNRSRVNTRNIVLDLAFVDDPSIGRSIEDCRYLSYRFFQVGKEVSVRVETDKRIAKITGHVESNEPTIFEPSSGCQISIICEEPYWRSIEPQIIRALDDIKMFEFPFSNEVIFSNESLLEKKIVMGEYLPHSDSILANRSCYIDVFYSGEIETGLKIKVTALDSDITSIWCFHHYGIDKMESMKVALSLLPAGHTLPGDTIIFNTNPRQKSIILSRDNGNIIVDIISTLDDFAEWIKLVPGYNVIEIVPSGTSRGTFDITLEYDVLYGGM